jgi:hypothetical protein
MRNNDYDFSYEELHDCILCNNGGCKHCKEEQKPGTESIVEVSAKAYAERAREYIRNEAAIGQAKAWSKDRQNAIRGLKTEFDVLVGKFVTGLFSIEKMRRYEAFYAEKIHDLART